MNFDEIPCTHAENILIDFKCLISLHGNVQQKSGRHHFLMLFY